ncbi:Serine/threonine-protein kinase, putative [Penicillium digitatum PHI26]|uniref:Serine/threonine-protein kinase, putative n=2 Tax=Penicillium digitatum TaxID=36651 RepID=K9G6P1_PEND2|nr:Serine/threonine-protein kinase, putative [Penicillium digitatum Pd1]EKV06844.1 Serine/threonine-protein kinase, putative [Penicillium digitatum Pd1]EKV08871.1 Serine/threonine-protein kinase, putative [Penicillium digitatum PHI26]
MAHSERAGLASGLAGLRIETKFYERNRPKRANENTGRKATTVGDGIESDHTNQSHNYARLRDTDEDRSLISDPHSATPPISVPRHDEQHHADSTDNFPHKPGDVQGSPLDNYDSYLHTRRPSISFNPKVSVDSGNQIPLEESLSMGEVKHRPPQKFESRSSGLRNALSQDDEHVNPNYESPSWSPKRSLDRSFPTGLSRAQPFTRLENDSTTGSELDRPTSLTSQSTVSPVTDEVRTPPDYSSHTLLSPFCVPSPSQSFASPEDRSSSWSGGIATPFGSKRSSTLDRSSSLRNSTRHSSRRSTNSSGKSPASMFLSMWNNVEEPALQPDDEGQMVGDDYVLGKQIGFGGFSVVKEAYKAERHGETKRLAVKIVKKQITGRSEHENDEVQAEFDHEVRVWRYLSHPHVLTLDAVYETDYATFCFTKLAIGGTLFDLIRQNRSGLDTQSAKKYAYQLACAIRYLHEDARVVHRDIKLENCLLDPIGSADGTTSSNLVLCDFGMAEWMSIDNGGDSPDPYEDAADRPPPQQMGPAGSSTSVAGSLEYASPELLQSVAGVVHPSVDIWAFGVIVYTIIVGSRPFQDSFAPRIQANILSGTWDCNAVFGDTMDGPLRQDRQYALDLIRGCLEMDPKRRLTIRSVLASSWLREVHEADEPSPDTVWRL